MITNLNKKRSGTTELGLINEEFYENIFSVYKIDKHFILNIMKKVSLPDGSINEDYIYYKVINYSAPWTNVSFSEYGSIRLWWLVCIMNNIMNPVHNVPSGSVLKFLKPEYVAAVLQLINQHE